MCTINVRICHDNNTIISDFFYIKVFSYTRTKSSNHISDFIRC